ncbi:MAG: hypothetical protein Q9218_007774 [Villophora microphyllina]
MRHIHWTAPTLIIASFICGTLFALGHHLFYASLDHKHASTSSDLYSVLGMHISDQQFNTAVGTAFAFMVRACLMLSISLAYFQIFIWTVKNHGTKGTKLGDLDVMADVLHDFLSLASLRTWRRRPWLLLPIASIVTPATLSVGFDFPPPMFLQVPMVDFASLNLAAPMAEYGTTGNAYGAKTGFNYMYAGPSLTVQRITDAVASQGTILPVPAPALNSTWNLNFNGPTLHCNSVPADFREQVLTNILNYTFARSQGSMEDKCTFGPGYMAWHPAFMGSDQTADGNLPFNLHNLNTSRDPLNNDNSHGYPYSDMASVFLAIAPTLFGSGPSSDHYLDPPWMCRGESWYQEGLDKFHNESTVLRCDMHNSTYDTTFTFIDGVQSVKINGVKDVSDTAMTTIGDVLTFFNSSNQTDTSLQPQPCPPSEVKSDSESKMAYCLFDPVVLSTISYQAVMHAFTDLVTGMISLGDRQDLQTLITSTSQVSSTVLAEVPELAFLQSTETTNKPQAAQQAAVTWQQQPYTGLVNAAAAVRSTLPFKEALEQVFQNITISLMSAPDLQPNSSSIYYPDKTEVISTTRENIYIYSASKLWLAYSLAVGATALIAVFGIVAIIANRASFSNKFSTILRLSRGAQMSYEINQKDLSGWDPLPDYASKATVRFSQEEMSGTRDGMVYSLVDKEGRNDDRGVSIQERWSE